MTQLSDLDYETIENAVMETARGRWFLTEYKKRNGVADTSTLLAAIGRLEKVVTSISKDFPPEVKAQADVKIPATPAFATSTPKAEKAPVSAAPAPAPEPAKPDSPSLSAENLQFFSNDEDLFADDANALLPETPAGSPEKEKAAPVAKPAEKKDTAVKAKKLEGFEKSPRFKVFKTNAADKANKADKADKSAKNPERKPAALQVSSKVPDPAMSPTKDEKDRIVIIRSGSGKDVDIPLLDDVADLSGGKSSAPS